MRSYDPSHYTGETEDFCEVNLTMNDIMVTQGMQILRAVGMMFY